MAVVSFVILLSALCVGGFSQNVEVEDCPPTKEENVFIKVYDDTCYYFHLKEKTTFEVAKTTCKSQGGRMVQPRSQEANGYLWFFIIHLQKSDRVWFGALRDILVSGSPKYFWESGEEIPSSLVESIERYGVPHTVPRSNGVWHFDLADKSETHPFVCELRVDKKTTTTTTPAPTPPPPTTTTTTTTTTAPTTTVVPTPTTIASLVEKLCPHLPDIKQYMKLFGNTCFYFHMKSKESYSGAKEICEKEGGTLANLDSKLRDSFIGNFLKNTFTESKAVWIGLHKNENGTSYLWEDGTDAHYINFKPDVPFYGNAVMKYGYDFKWYSMWEEMELNFVCQFQAKT